MSESNKDPASDNLVVAERLWQLLDDIDTLDDACRDNDAAFRNAVRRVQKKRWEYAESDGYRLFWTHLGQSAPAGPMMSEGAVPAGDGTGAEKQLVDKLTPVETPAPPASHARPEWLNLATNKTLSGLPSRFGPGDAVRFILNMTVHAAHVEAVRFAYGAVFYDILVNVGDANLFLANVPAAFVETA